MDKCDPSRANLQQLLIARKESLHLILEVACPALPCSFRPVVVSLPFFTSLWLVSLRFDDSVYLLPTSEPFIGSPAVWNLHPLHVFRLDYLTSLSLM